MASVVPLGVGVSSSAGDGPSSGGANGERTTYRSVATGLLASGPLGLMPPGMRPVGSGHYAPIAAANPSASNGESASADGGAASAHRPLLGELTKYKYSRLNLTTNQHGECDRTSIVKHHRQVSMFWQEKLALFLMFLQFHALIWLQCYQFYPKKSVEPTRTQRRTRRHADRPGERADANSLAFLVRTGFLSRPYPPPIPSPFPTSVVGASTGAGLSCSSSTFTI